MNFLEPSTPSKLPSAVAEFLKFLTRARANSCLLAAPTHNFRDAYLLALLTHTPRHLLTHISAHLLLHQTSVLRLTNSMVRKHFRADMPPLSIPSVNHAPVLEEIAQPPPVQKQAAISKPSSCCSIRVDFKHNDPCYVFRTTHSATSNLVAASVSDNSVKIYSLKGNQLVHQAGLLGHTGTITDINFCSSDTTPDVLMSSSKDGSVRGWDARSGHQVEG